MSSLNRVTLIGNLGTDPDQKFTMNGECIVNLSIATTDSWTDKNSGQRRDKTEWHRVVCFKQNADVAAKYLSKGSQVFVEGSLTTSSWEDRRTGEKKYRTEIRAQKLILLGSRADSSSQSQNQETTRKKYESAQKRPERPQSAPPLDSEPDDDVPF